MHTVSLLPVLTDTGTVVPVQYSIVPVPPPEWYRYCTSTINSTVPVRTVLVLHRPDTGVILAMGLCLEERNILKYNSNTKLKTLLLLYPV